VSITENDKETQVSLFWISLLRIMLGLLFLTTWWSNQSKGFYTPDGLQYFFTQVFPQSENSLTWYAAFIDNIILPARAAFAPFQLFTEFFDRRVSAGRFSYAIHKRRGRVLYPEYLPGYIRARLALELCDDSGDPVCAFFYPGWPQSGSRRSPAAQVWQTAPSVPVVNMDNSNRHVGAAI
jgi:hypothetical protein